MHPDDLRRLEEVGTEVQIDAGHVLIERGQPGTGLYVIVEGTVVVEAPEGTRELGRGAVVGERGILSGTRTARVQATSDLRVLVVDRTAVERLCADPEFASRLATASDSVEMNTSSSSE
jgi:CRP-like cAMP-binding protein